MIEAGETIISLKNVFKIFGPDPRGRAFDLSNAGVHKDEVQRLSGHVVGMSDISFDVKRGEIFVVMGLSGSGKSTAIRTVNKLHDITSGSVTVDGVDVQALRGKELQEFRRETMGMVFQHFALFPHINVIQNTSYGLKVQGVERRERESAALKALDMVGLEAYANNKISELSGGMQQRVGLARALCSDPPILLMDEAFSALDPLIRRQMQDELMIIQKQLKKTILFITHDLNLLLEFADRLAIMKNGKVIELGQTQKIRTGGEHSYTQKLIGALPSASGPRKKGLLSKPKNRDFGSTPLLEVKNLSKDFPVSGFFRPKLIEAVKEISFQVFPGEIVALVGESGSGKSTIAKLITRLIRPTSGDIFLNGSNKKVSEARRVPLEYRKQVQMVFQDPFGSLNSVHTVYHHLERPIKRHKLMDESKIYQYIIDMLEAVDLSPGIVFADKFPHEMSGGERQRVAIARALSLKPELIIADEPTSMLDVSIRLDILRILANLRNQNNVAILFITHDLASARYLADRIIVLQNGKQVEEGLSEELTGNPQHHYTKQLIAAASPGWLKKNLENL